MFVPIDHTYGVSRMIFNRRTGSTKATFVVTNVSLKDAGPPLWFSIKSISDPTVTWVNYDGVMPNGDLYVDLAGLVGGDGELSAGESTDGFDLIFHNPSRVRFTFDTSLLGTVV